MDLARLYQLLIPLLTVLLRVQGHISNNPEVGTLGHILVSLSVPRFLKAYIHGPSLGTDPS